MSCDYPVNEGKYGPIFQIADGVRVRMNEFGKWELVMKHKGQRKKRTVGEGEEGLELAIKQGELLALKLGLLSTAPNNEKTFGMVAEEWLQLNHKRWTPTTVERYSGLVKNYLNPYLGGFPLNRIDRAKVKRMLADLSQIRSPKTIELVHAAMSGVFSEAIDLGYANENPARGLLARILPPKRKRAQNAPDPFSKDDLNRFLSEAHRCLMDPYPLTFDVLALTGMRLGECLAMHLENLDVRHSQYMVAESVRYGHFGQPKTGKRLIDLPESLTKQLEQHILKLRKKAMAEGRVAGYLFPEFTHRLVQGAMKRACISARLRARSPHDLRHTYATLLLMDHYSPAYVQKQLGHHSITMTVDIYGHWLPGEGKKDLESTLRWPADGLEHRKGRLALSRSSKNNA